MLQPYIDSTGLHTPGYIDIRDMLIADMKNIFGEDVYLGDDSQDYQMLSIIARYMAYVYDGIQAVHLGNKSSNAIGVSQDMLFALTGIKRKKSTHSTVSLELAGVGGTVINNGIVKDQNSNKWIIKGRVTIPQDGKIIVQATAENEGAIFADPNTITTIDTLVFGWTSVTNPSQAILGINKETDPQFGARHKISVARPSRTIAVGILGRVLELEEVQRAKLYENDTNVFGFYGPPINPHSLCFVVEGGNDYEIAETIYVGKTQGCGTNGDIEIKVTDEMEEYPMEVPPIKFYRPTYVEPFVRVEIAPKNNFINSVVDTIKEKITDYLNELEIGQDLIRSSLYTYINEGNVDNYAPMFSTTKLEIGATLSNLSETDMPIEFKEVTRGLPQNIEVVVVT